MNITEKKTKKIPHLAAWYNICPVAHIVALLSACVIALHLLLRGNKALMQRFSDGFVRPCHALFARASSFTRLSLAEVFIALAVLFVLALCVRSLVRLVRKKATWRGAYALFMRLFSLVCAVYAGFCVLWGVYYYADDFLTRSDLSSKPVSVTQLEFVTRYFADLANEYGAVVARDDTGAYLCDRADVIARSAALFDKTVQELPVLDGPRVPVKAVRFSRVMSYIDFTGFFFPFTGEANVNIDFPSALFPSTVAHELSHQRGVAKEQEANFVAVLASLRSGDADFCYSAALLAYTHLGNALYSADHAAWESVYFSLDESVRRDLSLNNAYWRQFETPVQSVSNTVYEGFLYSYDQTLGLKSYGACVDLLVNYYLPAADE